MFNLKQRTHSFTIQTDELFIERARTKFTRFPRSKRSTTKFLVMRIDYGLRIASGFVEREVELVRKNATRSLFVAEEFSPRWKVKACGLRLRKVFLPFSLFFAFRCSFNDLSFSLSRDMWRKINRMETREGTKVASLRGCWLVFFFFSFSFARERIVGYEDLW